MSTQLREGRCRKSSAPISVGREVESVVQLAESSLERRFGHLSTLQQRRQIATEAHEAFAASMVTNYLPILIERRAIQIANKRLGPPET